MNKKKIPLSVPNFSGNELQYVSKAVQSEWVSTGGSYINEFETALTNYVHCKGTVACQSGTAGLHTALLSLSVTRDDAVIVPTLTFIAAVNPVRYINAQPIFMDCDDSLCMDMKKLEQFCEQECKFVNGRLFDRRTKKHIKAVIVVHIFGNMANMEFLTKLSEKYHFNVIEDATEALGTYYTEGPYKGRYAGTIGDIGVYSFNGNKIITTGGGGAIVSNNEAILKRAKHLTTQAKSNTFYYEHDEVGYNYRMTNLQAALGLAQLEQLEQFIQIKHRNYKLFKQYFDTTNEFTLLPFQSGTRSNQWFYSMICNCNEFPRDVIIHYFEKHNIQSRPIWGLIHEQIPYRQERTYQIEKAFYYQSHIVNIPCSTNLSPENIKYIEDVVTSIKSEFIVTPKFIKKGNSDI